MKTFFHGSIITLSAVSLLVFGGVVQAQESNGDTSVTTQELQQQIDQLQQQINDLQTRIQAQVSNRLQTSTGTTSTTTAQRFRIDQRLSQGDRGPDVRRLQELLASNSEVYPEGLTTGYFGPLTASAVARLQTRLGLPSVGQVGSSTLSRVNELLEEGAGSSGVIPPGLLTAPGLQRVFSDDDATTTDATTTDDEMEEEDGEQRGPDIEQLPIPDNTKQQLRSIFDNFDDDRQSGDDDDEDTEEDSDTDELEIEAETEDGTTTVDISYSNGTESEFVFSATSRNETVTQLSTETDLSEAEIDSVLTFESESSTSITY